MKNLTLLFAIGLILLTGCTKDESKDQFDQQFDEKIIDDTVIVLEKVNGKNTWEAMPISELQKGIALKYDKVDGASAHTNGYYESTNRDATIISWLGTQTYGGVRGSAEVKMTAPDYSFQFAMETECVTVNGNEAVYGGVITEIRGLSGKPPVFDLGWRFYFKVIDYQRGGHQFDKIANMLIFASPMSPSICGSSGPSNHIWASQGYSEVQRPGFVEVSK